MELPGGLLRADGIVDRTFAWKPVDGSVEQAFAAAAEARSRTEAISRALEAALERVAGSPASRARVDALSVPDRRYLMIQLAGMLGLASGWSSHRCGACGERFDFALDLAALPVKPAGAGYPAPAVQTAAGPLRLRVPTGADQLRLPAARGGSDALQLLASLCLPAEGPEAATDVLEHLTQDDLDAVDAALEEAAPQIPWAIRADCPECEAANVIAIDVAAWLSRMVDGPLGDVHEIAAAYGWSECDILALPRVRRLKYLELIRGRRDDPHTELS